MVRRREVTSRRGDAARAEREGKGGERGPFGEVRAPGPSTFEEDEEREGVRARGSESERERVRVSLCVSGVGIADARIRGSWTAPRLAGRGRLGVCQREDSFQRGRGSWLPGPGGRLGAGGVSHHSRPSGTAAGRGPSNLGSPADSRPCLFSQRRHAGHCSPGLCFLCMGRRAGHLPGRQSLVVNNGFFAPARLDSKLARRSGT